MTYSDFLQVFAQADAPMPEADVRALDALWRRFLRWALRDGVVVQTGTLPERAYMLADASMTRAIAPQAAPNVLSAGEVGDGNCDECGSRDNHDGPA